MMPYGLQISNITSTHSTAHLFDVRLYVANLYWMLNVPLNAYNLTVFLPVTVYEFIPKYIHELWCNG